MVAYTRKVSEHDLYGKCKPRQVDRGPVDRVTTTVAMATKVAESGRVAGM
jgi:hypothetical protein